MSENLRALVDRSPELLSFSTWALLAPPIFGLVMMLDLIGSHGIAGQELCEPGMWVDAVVSLSAGTVDVSSCAYRDDSRRKP